MVIPRRFAPLTRWAFMSGQVVGMQLAVQATNALTGLFLVRTLPKDEYAWFTIAASMLATVSLLADGGVSTGLTAIGGRIFTQPGPFARLLQDGLRFSSRLVLLGFLLAAPFFYALYGNVAAPRATAVAAILLAGLAAWPSISTVLFNVANRLHARVRVIQLAELTGALTRLGLTGVVLLSGSVTMLAAFAATVASGFLQALVVRIQTRRFLLAPAQEVSYRPELGGFVRSLYANHIFFCVQAQIATWIIGWLAGSAEVADLGALGRLNVLLTAIMAPFHYLAVPAIARIHDMKTLRLRFLVTFLAATFIAIFVVIVAWWQPTPFLWLLGANYVHLTVELPLALSAQGLGMITSLAWVLILTRGWVSQAWITILTSVLGLAIGAALFPLNTVTGTLAFTMVSVLPTLAFCLGTIIWNLAKSSPSSPIPTPT